MILLADDEAPIRELLAGFLARLGYQVHACADGEAAWQWLREGGHPCEAVVADIKMPTLSGTALLRRIREQHLDVPVVLVSGQVDFDTEAATQAGAVGILYKPFRMADLVDLLERIAPGHGDAT